MYKHTLLNLFIFINGGRLVFSPQMCLPQNNINAPDMKPQLSSPSDSVLKTFFCEQKAKKYKKNTAQNLFLHLHHGCTVWHLWFEVYLIQQWWLAENWTFQQIYVNRGRGKSQGAQGRTYLFFLSLHNTNYCHSLKTTHTHQPQVSYITLHTHTTLAHTYTSLWLNQILNGAVDPHSSYTNTHQALHV